MIINKCSVSAKLAEERNFLASYTRIVTAYRHHSNFPSVSDSSKVGFLFLTPSLADLIDGEVVSPNQWPQLVVYTGLSNSFWNNFQNHTRKFYFRLYCLSSRLYIQISHLIKICLNLKMGKWNVINFQDNRIISLWFSLCISASIA